MSAKANPVTGRGFLELAKAGMDNAAKAMETMVPQRLAVDILWAGSVPTENLSQISGNPEDVVVGAYVHVEGDAPGHALLLFSERSAMMLADLVMSQPVGTTVELSDMEYSLVMEMANILTSSYLTSMADHCHIAMLPEPPQLAVDMAGALIQNILVCSGQFERETLSIVTRFRTDTDIMDGLFLYIPETVAL